MCLVLCKRTDCIIVDTSFTIQTERLILRPMTMADWPDYAALMMSERAIHMDGPMGKAKAWGMFCHDVAQWSLFGHGALMFDDRQSHACLGQVGINAGPLFPETELGWFVYSHAEGKGYAYEAACALRDWAFKVRQFESLVSYITLENQRSIRLAERMGAVLDRDAQRPEPGVLVYRHRPPPVVE